MDEIVRPNYWAVIPAQIRYDDRIPPNAKLLYGEISALLNDEGFCFAGNGYFASIYGVAEETISRLIAKLEKCGYVHRQLEKDKTGQIVRRKIYLDSSITCAHPLDEIINTPCQKNQGGIDEKVKDTNTSITNKKESKKKKAAAEEAELSEDALSKDIIDWIARAALVFGWTRDQKNLVYRKTMEFYQPSGRKKEPSRRARQVHLIQSRCERFSEGDPKWIAEMLDRATVQQWANVFDSEDYHGRQKESAQEAPDEEYL